MESDRRPLEIHVLHEASQLAIRYTSYEYSEKLVKNVALTARRRRLSDALLPVRCGRLQLFIGHMHPLIEASQKTSVVDRYGILRSCGFSKANGRHHAVSDGTESE